MMMPMIIFGRYYSIYNVCNLAPGNNKLLLMNSIKRPYLRGKQTQILTSMLQHPGIKIDKNRFGLAQVSE